jgi:hypothetical protein
MSTGLLKFLNAVMHEKREKKFSARIVDSHILNGIGDSTPFMPNASYFQIRLAEMYLREKRELWTEFIPLGIAIADFIYKSKQETVPCFVGNESIAEFSAYTDKQFVELRNTRILGPFPYVGGEVGLFIGLVQIKAGDLTEQVFKILAKVVKAFDLSGISRYMEIAKPLSEGLDSFLGIQANKLQFAFRDVFNEREGDNNRFRQGYIAFVNCNENALSADTLWIKDDRLSVGSTKESTEPFSAYDYCLVKFEHLSERGDYSVLPFYPLWEDTKKYLVSGRLQEAELKKIELFQALAVSPDLTDEHRELLIQVFASRFKKMQNPNEDNSKPENAHKGGKVLRNRVRDQIQAAAEAAISQRYSLDVIDRVTLLKESNNPSEREAIIRADPSSDNALLTREFSYFKNLRVGGNPEPEKLAHALALGVMRSMSDFGISSRP